MGYMFRLSRISPASYPLLPTQKALCHRNITQGQPPQTSTQHMATVTQLLRRPPPYIWTRNSRHHCSTSV